MKTATLPDKPSLLIHTALDDLEVIEKSKKYLINMAVFHDPLDGRKMCEVCLAGCVMANTLGSSRNDCVEPSSFSDKLSGQLNALDFFRMGSVEAAFVQLGLGIEKLLPADIDIYEYDMNPKEFKSDMRALADLLYGLGY